MSESKTIALTASRERSGQTYSGYLMLLVLLIAIVVQVWGIFGLANGGDGAFIHIIAVIVAPLVLLFIACGFYMLPHRCDLARRMDASNIRQRGRRPRLILPARTARHDNNVADRRFLHSELRDDIETV